MLAQMAKAKARKRALEKQRGTAAHDLFIPARNARPLPDATHHPPAIASVPPSARLPSLLCWIFPFLSVSKRKAGS